MSSAQNPQNRPLTYTYDQVGNRESMHSADSGRFTYSCDAANQNTMVLNPFSERTTFNYDASGRQTVPRMSNGTRASLVYDANGRRTNVDNLTSSGAAIETFAYGYDLVGNPTSRVEASGDRTTWTYDASNRLLSERRSGANSYAQTFTYDPAGNRTLKNEDSARTTYVYDTANQLDYSQAAAGRTTYVFDNNGNQRIEQPPAGARTTVTWDYENQPTQYQLPSGSRMTLAYNADNRRVLKETSSGTTKFIWDPAADAYQSELDGSGATQAVYTNPPVSFGSIISQRRGSTSHWFHRDSLGSTWALTNSSQTKTDTYLYDAWGNPLSSSGTTVNPFRWVGNVGYYFDFETGLYYIRARVYQPTIARWTSVDPLFYMLACAGVIGFGWRDAIGYNDGRNLFAYARSSPIVYLDAYGFKSCKGTKSFLIDNEGCDYYPDMRPEYFGFRFTIDIEFKDPCCECCSFRQFLLYKTYMLEMRHVDDNRRPTGDWLRVPLPYPEYLEHYVGEGKEDCGWRYGVWTCYGYRDNQFEESKYDECKFYSRDTPGVDLRTLLGDLLPIELIESSRLEFRLTIDWRYLFNVIDTCNYGNVVEGRTLEQTCSEDFWKSG